VRRTVLLLALAPVALAAEPAPPAHEEVRVTLEAGAAFHSNWTSGKTIHSGIGTIQPYGATDYWCGVGYAEAAPFPMDKAVAPWMLANANDKQPLFCVYRTPKGDIYAYDILVGPIEAAHPPSLEKLDSLVNFVVGGTVRFAGSTGVWVGTASGRGEGSKSGNGLIWPKSIIKQMEGYLRLPAKGAH
jgi:hypothetical protein